MSIVTLTVLHFCIVYHGSNDIFSSLLQGVQSISRGGSFCCFTLGIAYRYTIVNPCQRLRLLCLLLLLRPFPQPAPHDLLTSQVSTLPALFLNQLDAPQALFVHYSICSSPRSSGSLSGSASVGCP